MEKVAIIPSTVGFHWEELYDAYKVFKSEGWEIDLYTDLGKPAKVDPKSIEKHPLLSLLGLGVSDSNSPATELGKEISYRTAADVKAIYDMVPENYDAIYLPGGHGCLLDVNVNPTLHEKIYQAYKAGKILSAVCHATSTFAFVKDEALSIVAGKKITGFPDVLDNILIKTGWVYEQYLPLPFSNQKKLEEAGADIKTTDVLQSNVNPYYHVTDLPFITGAGPKTAKSVAQKVVAAVFMKKFELKKELIYT